MSPGGSPLALHAVDAESDIDFGCLDPAYLFLQVVHTPGRECKPTYIQDSEALERALRVLSVTPVVHTHKIGILYVAAGQTTEAEILANTCGSPSYTRVSWGYVW